MKRIWFWLLAKLGIATTADIDFFLEQIAALEETLAAFSTLGQILIQQDPPDPMEWN